MILGTRKSWFASLLMCVAALVHGSAPDEPVLRAREAFAAGDRVALARSLEASRGHVLEPYVEYWYLRQRLDEVDATQIEAFLGRYEGDLLAEKLRGDWLKLLAGRGQWERFDREFPKLVQPDRELDCYRLERALSLDEPGALEQARMAWLDELDFPASCNPVLDRLVGAGRVGREELWQRLRRLLENHRVAAAGELAARLPAAEAPDPRTLKAIAADPRQYLRRVKPNFAANRRGREMVMYALARLAAADPRAAAMVFEPFKARLSPAERAYVYGQLGWQGALRHLPEALAWYKAADDVEMGEEQLAWKARAALRASDWRVLRAILEAMPQRLAVQPVWIYWLGRAQLALGRRNDAQRLFERIAGRPDFYGNLADEELGRPLAVPVRAAAAGAGEIEAVAELPGMRRALELFRLDLRVEAVRQWNWMLRGRGDRFLLAAAELARSRELFDRAIFTAERTTAEHDYRLRFLAPFREYVEPQLKSLDLDDAWVYGLMRQESRFVMSARSSSGARGLMQLMPSTAKWVARRIGLKDFTMAQANDTSVNVLLGTNYLRMVLDGLENHPVLASAAYNAGPGRARRWRDAQPIEGAIWVETIPITETRRYVKKVMSNSLYYDALFNGRPRSLKQRLGVIPAASANGGAG